MDLLFILRDALASSFLGNLALALNAREAGHDVGVLVTQEALAAVARGSLAWPRELSGQETRWLLADRGAEAGLPIAARGEGRRIDAMALLSKAREAGVVLYACPTWVFLLNLADELPGELQTLEPSAVTGLLMEAKQVIGTL